MGMDLVELVMDIEDRYDIAIHPADFGETPPTFGDLVDLVCRKINESRNAPLEAMDEEFVLAALLTQLRTLVPESVDVNSKTPMKVFAPALKRDENDVWGRLRERFPELHGWREYCRAGVGCGCVTSLVLMAIWFAVYRYYIITNYFPTPSVSFLAGLCLGAATALFWWLFFSEALNRGKNLGELARMIVEKRRNRLRSKELPKSDIENELRSLICDSFGLKPENVHRESLLTKDLGLS